MRAYCKGTLSQMSYVDALKRNQGLKPVQVPESHISSSHLYPRSPPLGSMSLSEHTSPIERTIVGTDRYPRRSSTRLRQPKEVRVDIVAKWHSKEIKNMDMDLPTK